MLALGTIETVGLAAAIEAADRACKTADIHLIGYELTKGGGYVVVKVEGQVAAVQTAMQAAQAAASRVSRVVGVSVIPRPSSQMEPIIRNSKTVGWQPEPPAAPVIEAEPTQPAAEAAAAPVAETATEPVAEAAPVAEPAPEVRTESPRPTPVAKPGVPARSAQARSRNK